MLLWRCLNARALAIGPVSETKISTNGLRML